VKTFLTRDITLGQFFPGKSVLHRLDPRVKILAVFLNTVMIFVINNFPGLILNFLQVFIIILLSNINLKNYFKNIKMIMMLIIFTAVLNIFYGKGEAIFSFYFLKITWQGINNSIFIALRIISLVFISSAFTFTTSPTDITDALERLMKPLKFFKIGVHEIAMIMTIALRFVPTLLEETEKIMNAQKARGANLESGNLTKRIKSLIPILIPLFVSSFRRAYDLAMAMECRCYQGGEGRTRMKILKLNLLDFLSICIVIIFSILLIMCNFKFPGVL